MHYADIKIKKTFENLEENDTESKKIKNKTNSINEHFTESYLSD